MLANLQAEGQSSDQPQSVRHFGMSNQYNNFSHTQSIFLFLFFTSTFYPHEHLGIVRGIIQGKPVGIRLIPLPSPMSRIRGNDVEPLGGIKPPSLQVSNQMCSLIDTVFPELSTLRTHPMCRTCPLMDTFL